MEVGYWLTGEPTKTLLEAMTEGTVGHTKDTWLTNWSQPNKANFMRL